MSPLKLSMLLMVCLTAPALALTQQETAAFRRTCGTDYQRFCSAYEPDSPQVQECFRAKMNELSKQCREAIVAQNRGAQGR